MKTPVNASTLKQHFTYSWWKYLLALAAGIFLVDLIYTVTTPKVPEDKKIEFYVYGYANTESLNAYMEKVRQEQFPDQQEMRSVSLVPDDTYGPMQLVTYLAAREGDLYLLPRDQFLSLSANDAFMYLENDEELMAFFTDAGANLKRGWRTSESGETHLVGIPVSFLPGLSSYAYAEDGFLCLLAAGGNEENTLKFFRILCQDMITAPAEEVQPQQQQQ